MAQEELARKAAAVAAAAAKGALMIRSPTMGSMTMDGADLWAGMVDTVESEVMALMGESVVWPEPEVGRLN